MGICGLYYDVTIFYYFEPWFSWRVASGMKMVRDVGREGFRGVDEADLESMEHLIGFVDTLQARDSNTGGE